MTPSVTRVAVLASGHGSNLQAMLDAASAGHLEIEVVGVYSDNPQARALQRARAAHVPAIAICPADYATRRLFDETLFARIDAVHPDLIVCAGYMRLITATQVDAHSGRLLNIHPSLLPAFKGLRTHQQALDAGVVEHGASVHYVSRELDGGAVVSQARVPVRIDDDAGRLGQRVLQREHPLLIETLRWLVAGRVRWIGDRIEVDGHVLNAPLQLDHDNCLKPGD